MSDSDFDDEKDICYEVDVLDSYDIVEEACKSVAIDVFNYDESDQVAFCTKGQETSDENSYDFFIKTMSLFVELYNDMDGSNFLIEQNFIKNVTYKKECKSCFAYRQNMQSYDINMNRCKKFVMLSGNSEAPYESSCEKEAFELMVFDGFNLDTAVLENLGIIENVVKGNGIEIIDYKCYEGNLKGLPVISEAEIPSTLFGETVKCIGHRAFAGKNLTNIVIPDGLISIGAMVFLGNNLTNIVIPDSLISIGEYAFIKNSGSNRNLTTIVNKTGREFDWQSITGGNGAATFVTGTVSHDNGNITVTDSE